MNACNILLGAIKETPVFWFDILFVVLCVSLGALIMRLCGKWWIWRNKE